MESSTNGEPVIEISHVNHYYGSGEAKTHTLSDNTLDVRKGEIVFLTGPSGSGKTTLLTLIGTLRTVQQGSLKVLGHELNGIKQHDVAPLRKHIGFIFQAHNLFDSLTAFQNVRMATDLIGMPRSESKPKIEQVLTRFGLGDRIHYKPKYLSGGQKQRVAIARGLIHNPRILLADEPTAALDESSGRDAVTMFREMADRAGCTVLMVTHDNRILDIADRIVSMVGGRIKNDADLRLTETICEFLRKCKFFNDLTPRTLTEVANNIETREYKQGDHIVRQGEEGNEFFMIVRGGVDVVRVQADNREILSHMTDGAYFGEVALLKKQLRNATVTATEPTVCYVLNYEKFREVVESSDSFSAELRKAVFERT